MSHKVMNTSIEFPLFWSSVSVTDSVTATETPLFLYRT